MGPIRVFCGFHAFAWVVRPVVGWSTAAAAVLAVTVGCAPVKPSDRPANVTRRYPNFWPQDADVPPYVTPRVATLRAADVPLAAVIRRWITPGARGHDGVDVHAEGRSVIVTAPVQTQTQVERLIAEESVKVRMVCHCASLQPSQVRAAGLTLPAVGTAQTLTADEVAAFNRIAFPREAGRVDSLEAPRFTPFTGERVVLLTETRQAYVSSVTPIVTRGSVAFEPVISTIPSSGLRMSMRATVTPDRKFAYLDARLDLRYLLALDPVEMTATAGRSTTRATYQVPREETATVAAPSIRVPSGGWVWARGRPVATYGVTVSDSAPPPPLDQPYGGTGPPATPTTQPAEAAEWFAVWHVVVLPPDSAEQPRHLPRQGR